MKKISFIIPVLVLFMLISIPSNATELLSEQQYEKSINMMVSLGVLEEKFSPDDAITRADYCKIIIELSGQGDKTALYQDSVFFSDVPTGVMNGYIGTAVEMGYITQMPDGLFHPDENITYSQLSVALVKLLGYTQDDLAGYWPYNYINLLNGLNIFEGIDYTAQSEVLVKDFAVIGQRLFETKTKNGTENFVDTTKVFQEIIVLETGEIDATKDQRRVETDKGVLYLDSEMPIPMLGYSYIVRTDDNPITAMSGKNISYSYHSVREVSQGTITLNDGKNIKLQGDITYYYDAQTIEVDEALNILKTNSSIIIASNSNGQLYYGVIYDPVYSTPKIIDESMTSSILERMYSGMFIDRGGQKINSTQLEINDVAYKVTDIWGEYGFILVYNNEVSGEITAILPNLISPESIQIEGTSYELNSSFPFEKINDSGTIETGQTVTILLGEDESVVDAIISGMGNNSNYVLVLDAYNEKSQQSENFGEKLYFVTLLHTDGGIQSYLVEKDMSVLKGDLAKYEVIGIAEGDDEDYNTVSLTGIENSDAKTHEIFKDERKIDDSYVTDNVIIFNMIHNVYGRTSDAQILKWSDLPAGKVRPSKIKYIHTTGEFQDIDILYLDNILDEGIQYGLVTYYKTNLTPEGTTQTITMLIKGEEYTYTTVPITGIKTGAVLRCRMSGNTILDIENLENPYVTANEVQAADTSRVRISSTTYKYHRDFVVYEMGTDNTYRRVGTDNILNEIEKSFTLYLDKPLSYGGKVVMVVIR